MRYEDVEASPGYQLWLATNAWQRAIRRALEPFGLTHVQFVILASIDFFTKMDQQPSQVDVSRFADLDVNMTSQVLRSLEERGLVVRSDSPTDRRAHLLGLTELGDALRKEARAAVIPAKDAFLRPLGSRVDELAELLKALTGNRVDSA